MATKANAVVGVSLEFDDGSVREVYENDLVKGLRYRVGDETKKVSGSVRVICATTAAQNKEPSDCPPNPYLSRFVTPTKLYIDASQENHARIERIDVSSVVGIESVLPPSVASSAITVGLGPQYKSLAEVLADAPDGADVYLAPGIYAEPLTLTRSVRLWGGGEATLTGAITVVQAPENADSPAPIDVVLNGLHLTGGATVAVDSGRSFEMTNCVFEGHDLAAKTMPIAIRSADPIRLRVFLNTFGAQNNFSYNLIDVYGKLKDGSEIADNVFAESCCSHNQISLYGLDDGAVVRISGNRVARSENLLRIGFKGTPKGAVEIADNVYESTADGEYAGLFLVQPYGKETESFAGLTIRVTGNAGPEGVSQVGYLYAGKNDTPFTDENKPVVYLEGERTELPDASPVPETPSDG